MAEPVRIEFADAACHVTRRGLERRAIVRDDDRGRWLGLLDRVGPLFQGRFKAARAEHGPLGRVVWEWRGGVNRQEAKDAKSMQGSRWRGLRRRRETGTATRWTWLGIRQ